MGRPKKQAPGIGKTELDRLLQNSLLTETQLCEAQEHYKELYQGLLALNPEDDTEEIRELIYKLRQEGQFLGLMIDGSIEAIRYVINRNKYLCAYTQHKQLMWENTRKTDNKQK